MTEEVRTDVALVQDGVASPLYRELSYKKFPVNEYSKVGIIAYQYLHIPPDPKYAQGRTEAEPGVRFLFQSIDDPELRKWSNWCKVLYTYSPNASKLVKFFNKIPGLGNLITNNKWLFNTPFKIDCVADGEYVNITKAIIAEHDVSHLEYDLKFVPYKTIKVFKNILPLELCVVKTKNGLYQWTNETMIEKPSGLMEQVEQEA